MKNFNCKDMSINKKEGRRKKGRETDQYDTEITGIN
jgi:hypothetical protein